MTKQNFISGEIHFGSHVNILLTFSWRRSLSYRDQSTDLQSKSMDWYLHDRDLHYERVNLGEGSTTTFTSVNE